MEELIASLKSLIPANFDVETFLMTMLLLCAGFLVLGGLARLIFGKRSLMSQSVSSAIGIFFIYAFTVVIYSFGVNLNFLVSPLPFIFLRGEYLHIFSFLGADYVTICGQLLNMVILAFLVNVVDRIMPKGKHIISWLFFRCVSIVAAMLLHVLVNMILTALLPEGLLTWAPVILLALLFVMLLAGALKFLVGTLIASVNPMIGFLYTFFFATIVGKMLSRAVFTTLIISGLVLALNHLGVVAVCIGSSVLVAYLPLLIILLVLWYIIGRLM